MNSLQFLNLAVYSLRLDSDLVYVAQHFLQLATHLASRQGLWIIVLQLKLVILNVLEKHFSGRDEIRRKRYLCVDVRVTVFCRLLWKFLSDGGLVFLRKSDVFWKLHNAQRLRYDWERECRCELLHILFTLLNF